MSIKRHIAILNSHLNHWQRLLENKICDIDEGRSTIEALKMAIKLLESQDDWIPVSERLPEDFQRVLVTIVNYKGNKVVRVAEYYNGKGVFQIKENHEQWEVGEKGLLAWMSLPTPFEPQESEGENK